MARGRKPKPTITKDLAGNPGHRPLNKLEPKYNELSSVDAPEWLDDMARESWNWYCPLLVSQKILTQADLHNLEVFCSSYSRWRQAELDVKTNGIILYDQQMKPYKNPANTVIAESIKQLLTSGAFLGLDPSSRQKIVAPKGPGANPFANL
jgi:P27 family predicted phage terminase small subunit